MAIPSTSVRVRQSDQKVPQSIIGVHKKPTAQWLNNLYNTALFSDEELLEIYNTVKFQGFNRDEMLIKLEEKIGDVKVVVELIILCSLRGPRAAFLVKLRSGKSPKDYGIPASDQKGSENLSCSRISAATADLAAFYLKKLNVSKRVMDSELPGWLQFPTAGSIKMPANLRQLHIEFAKKFSTVIGGEFNEQIYSQMMANEYLDPNLKLFE